MRTTTPVQESWLPSFHIFLNNTAQDHRPFHMNQPYHEPFHLSRLQQVAHDHQSYTHRSISPQNNMSLTDDSEYSSCSDEELSLMDRHPHQLEQLTHKTVQRHKISHPYAPGCRDLHTTRVKKKYLKQAQRYEIVQRVRAGEKQAHLAKEFGVSRAAVCYLFKHQSNILNRYTDPTDE